MTRFMSLVPSTNALSHEIAGGVRWRRYHVRSIPVQHVQLVNDTSIYLHRNFGPSGAAIYVGCDFVLLLLVTSLGGAREVTDAHMLCRVASHQSAQPTVRFFLAPLNAFRSTVCLIPTQVIHTNDGRKHLS